MNTITTYTGANGTTYVPCTIDADGTARFLSGKPLPTDARTLEGRELADYLAGK
jgi:hypothetical protein